LQLSPAPLTVKEAAKGLANPRKLKAPAFEAEVRRHLDEEVSQGQAFCAPSGKKEEPRYWSRDEKHLLRERALELCSTPQALSALQKLLGKEATGADGAFVEKLVRELVAEDRLFEHPAKTRKQGALLGASPPPPELPVLEREQHQKKLSQLINTCRDLMAKAGVTADELIRALAGRLTAPDQARPEPVRLSATEPAPVSPVSPAPQGGSTVDALILRAVSNSPVLSLADLRRDMPAELQGREFDEAVLRLADEQRVTVSQDADPSSFTEAERAGYVRDGAVWFTMISKRD
jgi:hypothetical protein